MRNFPALDLAFPPGAPELIDVVTGLLDDFGPAAIHETGSDAAPEWRVFFARPTIRDEAAVTLTQACAARGLTVATVDVPDDDWASRSQASLRAVRVGRVVVAPPWDVPISPRDAAVVVIQPSMGFGTGHHETTRLCLALMQTTDCGVGQVLDVGTGSGVLALAAAALGARSAEGIDVDPDAVANAEENLALNPSLAARADIRFRVSDLRSTSASGAGELATRNEALRGADLVLANLTGALLVAAVPHLLARTGRGGALILSGFQRHEASAVLTAFAVGADLVARQSEGDWEAALLRRR